MTQKLFIVFIVFMGSLIICNNTEASGKFNMANEALSEMGLSNYQPIKIVRYRYLMQLDRDLVMVCENRDTKKKVMITCTQSKGLLWEHHNWVLISIVELP